MSTLSVIIANYNHAHYLEGALGAILAQSYQPTEIIVIDDGSTDDSVRIIHEFETRFPIIRSYRNDENHGAVFTANRALTLASGDYVYASAVDDRVGPGLFEHSMRLLSEHPEAGLCCSDPASFDHTGIIGGNPNRWSDRPCYFSSDSLAAVLKGGFIAGHTAIAKRSAMLEVGGFLPHLKWVCDWFLWLVIGFRYGICYVPEPLAAFRRRADSFSAVGERDRVQQAEVLAHLLTLVRSPVYRDVLPQFVRSGVFHHFGPQAVDLVLGDTKHWNLETLLLMLFPLHEWSASMASDQQRRRANVSANLSQLVPWVIEQCRQDNVERTVIYGAGSHSEILLPLWREAYGPPITRIVVTDPGDSWEFMGLPVSRASDYRPTPGVGIVLSSNTFECEMAEACERMWPETPYFPLYHSRDGSDSTIEPVWEEAA